MLQRIVLLAIAAFMVANAATVRQNVGESTSFLIMGDWGGQSNAPYTTKAQVADEYGMSIVASQLNAQAVLALGDNFYETGLDGDEHCHRFEDTWSNVYTGKEFDVPFYVLFGNHDYKGNTTAQLAFANIDPTHRWKFPAEYYDIIVNSTAGWTAQFLMIDTVMLGGNNEFNSDGSQRYDDEVFKAPPGPSDITAAANQWSWIESTLANSTADYLFVAGHYSVLSGCQHGSDPILDLLLKPLLQKYNAHYMSGHDHCAQFIQDENINYIQQGAAHECCYKPTNADKLPKDSLKFSIWNDGKSTLPLASFSSLTMDKDEAYVVYYDDQGNSMFVTPKWKSRNA